MLSESRAGRARSARTHAFALFALLSLGTFFALAVAGCEKTERDPDSNPTAHLPERGAVELTRLPTPALRVCRVLRLIRRVCPHAVPEAPYATATAPRVFRGVSGAGAIAVCLDAVNRGTRPTSDRCVSEIFGIEAGHPTGPGPRGSKPPSYVHLLFYARRSSLTQSPRMFPFAWPRRPRAAAERGLLARHRVGPVFLGTRDWGGRTGDLVLAPRFPFGGEMGNHLIFMSREGGANYAFSLHAWEPFPRTVVTLRAIVESATPAR